MLPKKLFLILSLFIFCLSSFNQVFALFGSGPSFGNTQYTLGGGFQVFAPTFPGNGKWVPLTGGYVITKTGTWTAPTCPTACGTTASYPAYYCSGGNSLCSANSPATRYCPATAACSVACVANGSCSAATPACEATTYGTDNCGTSCSMTGAACPVACVPNGSCSASAPACGATTSGTDNCGTSCTKTGVTCPSATISLSSCVIPTFSSSCLANLNWRILNATGPNVLFNGSGISTNAIGDADRTLIFGSNSAVARDGSTTLATDTSSASCSTTAAGWSSTNTMCEPPSPTVTLTVDRALIRSGSTATITLNGSASYTVACTIWGVAGSPITKTYSTSNGVTKSFPGDTFATNPLTSAQVITITCSPAVAGLTLTTTQPTTETTRVDVVPTIQEI